MLDNVIAIEKFAGLFKKIFQNVMRMVPDRDKNDINLHRLIAFRLRIDGEAATREYLIGKIRDIIQCGYVGNFYDFIKDDHEEQECDLDHDEPDPLKA